MELYIVTGATGHIGGTLIKKLLADGHAVRGLAGRGNADFLSGADIYRGDLRQASTLEVLFRDLDKYTSVNVIHAGALITMKRKVTKESYEINVNGTKNILDLCVKSGISNIVYLSSVDCFPPCDGVIAEPRSVDETRCTSAYASSKAKATALCLNHSLPVKIVCPTAVIGPYDYKGGLQTRMLKMFMNGHLPVSVSGGYDFVDVRSVCDGILSALKRGKPNELYILGGRYAEAKELLALAACECGRKAPKHSVPDGLVYLGVPFCELYSGIAGIPPLFTSVALEALYSRRRYSHEKASRELGYTPIPLETTVRDTVRFLATQKNGA